MNVYPQEIDLLAANPPTIVTGTGTNTSGLQIAVKFPGGLMRTDRGGSPKECSLAYQIRFRRAATNLWTTPIFPRTTTDVYTTDANGYRHYPYLGGDAYGSLRRLGNCVLHGHGSGRA